MAPNKRSSKVRSGFYLTAVVGAAVLAVWLWVLQDSGSHSRQEVVVPSHGDSEPERLSSVQLRQPDDSGARLGGEEDPLERLLASLPPEQRAAARQQQLQLMLRAGRISPEDYGPSFEEDIEAIAISSLVATLDSTAEQRAAKICGLESWEQIQQLLAHLSERSPSTHRRLAALRDRALAAASTISEHMVSGWEAGIGLEVRQDVDEYNAVGWRKEPRPVSNAGRIQFSVSTVVGSRHYKYYFSSAEFPAFESQLELLWAEAGEVRDEIAGLR